MKTKLIFLFLLLLIFISMESFSQTVPGGGSECPRSYAIKRNNGNGVGDSQIKVFFDPIPSSQDIPSLTAVYFQRQVLTNIVLPAKGYVVNGKGLINYSLKTSSKNNKGNVLGNIPPAAKLVLEFTYATGMICRTDHANE